MTAHIGIDALDRIDNLVLGSAVDDDLRPFAGKAARDRESVAGTGVTVNAVLPGPTKSEGVVDFLGKVAAEHGSDAAEVAAEFLRTMRPSSLIKRFAMPEEVANLVTYLCGEGAAATTGAAIRVDGGVVRSIL